MCLYCSSESIHLNSSSPFTKEGCALLCPAGSLAWASDPARPPFFFFLSFKKRKEKKEKEIYDFFEHIYFKVWIFYVVRNINLVFKIPGFWRKCDKFTYISKNVFLCVAYGQYPNMFWMLFFIQKILEVLKNVFSHGFHKKNCFLAFLDFTTRL